VAVHTSAPGTYAVQVDARRAADVAIGQRIEVNVGQQKASGKITAAGVEFAGRLALPAGEQTLSVSLPDAKRTGPQCSICTASN